MPVGTGRVPATRAVPHSLQNFAPGLFTAPHAGQPACIGLPHSLQNRAPMALSLPQLAQIKTSVLRSMTRRPDSMRRTLEAGRQKGPPPHGGSPVDERSDRGAGRSASHPRDLDLECRLRLACHGGPHEPGAGDDEGDTEGHRDEGHRLAHLEGREGRGTDTKLRDGITELGLYYVAGIQSSTSVWHRAQRPSHRGAGAATDARQS